MMRVKTKSKVISHAGSTAGKRSRALAGWSAGDVDGRAAGRPEANEEEHCQDCGRSEGDRLQEAEKELSESHCSIMRAKKGGVDVTSWVDLRCV
jgi:hypothetical protein